MAGKRHIKLHKPRDISRFVANLINRVERDEVDSQKARDFGYLAKILLECFEKVELQEEIERLKDRLGMNDDNTENTTSPH